MKVNNKDTELTWGAWLLEGEVDTFLQQPVTKPRYEYDWKGSHGVEYDTSEVLQFEKVTFQFALVFTGNSIAAVNTAIDAFVNEVKTGAGVSLQVTEVGKAFIKVYFSACGTAEIVADSPYSIKVPFTFIYNY